MLNSKFGRSKQNCYLAWFCLPRLSMTYMYSGPRLIRIRFSSFCWFFCFPPIARWHVTPRKVRDASSFGCVFCGWVFSKFFALLVIVLWLQVGHFLSLTHNLHLRKNQISSDKSCLQNPTDLLEPAGHQHL